jgi:hypothetical protein
MTDKGVYICLNADQKTQFDDNLKGVCKCGQKIQFRPHAPTWVEKICTTCAFEQAKAEQAKGEKIKVYATPESWYAKKHGTK